MALSAFKGTLTSPGATGAQAITGVGFKPKLILFYASYRTAVGEATVDGRLSTGFAADDGGSITTLYQSGFSINASATTRAASSLNTNGILHGVKDTTGNVVTTDYLATFTSFDVDGFTINWTTLPATASIVTHFIALGGSDITAARCGTFTGPNNTASTDVTVAAGWTQPDLIFSIWKDNDSHSTALGNTNLDGYWTMSVGIDDANQYMSWYAVDDQSGGGGSFTHHRSGRMWSAVTNVPPIRFEGGLDVKANWPTDGFRAVWPTTTTINMVFGYCAVKGTFQKSLGVKTTPGAAGGTVDHDATFTPAASIFFGANMPANTAIQSADSTATLGAFGIGAYDGTNQGVAGVSARDNAATSVTGTYMQTKAWGAVQPGVGTPVLVYADATHTGTISRLTFPAGDTAVNREYGVLVLGSAAVGGPGYGDATYGGAGGTYGQLAASGTTQTGSATLAAQSGLTVSAIIEKRGSATLAAQSGLTATGSEEQLGSATLAAASNATATAQRQQFGASTLPASTGLSAAGTKELRGSVTAAATSGLTVSAVKELSSSATLAANSGQTASAVGIFSSGTTLPATTGMSVTGVFEKQGAATMAAASGLTVAGQLTLGGSATLSSQSGLASSSQLIASASFIGPALSGMSTTAGLLLNSSATMAAQSGMTASAQKQLIGSPNTMPALSGFSAAGQKQLLGASTLPAVSGQTATATKQLQGASTLIATSGASSSGLRTQQGSSTLAATSGFTVTARVTYSGAVQISGVSSMSVSTDSTVVHLGSATLSANSSLADATAQRIAAGVATLAGLSGTTATAQKQLIGATTLSGAGTLSASSSVLVTAACTLLARSGLSITLQNVVTASALLAGLSGVTAAGSREQRSGATLAAISNSSADGVKETTGSATLLGESGLFSDSELTITGIAILASEGTFFARAVPGTQDLPPPGPRYVGRGRVDRGGFHTRVRPLAKDRPDRGGFRTKPSTHTEGRRQGTRAGGKNKQTKPYGR